MSNVEAAGVSLDVLEDADSADVVTTDDEDKRALLVLNEGLDLTVLKVKL